MNPHPVIATSDPCRMCDGTGIYAAGAYLKDRFIHADCETCRDPVTGKPEENYIDWRPCGRCQRTGNESAVRSGATHP
jgi:hypothetical protein